MVKMPKILNGEISSWRSFGDWRRLVVAGNACLTFVPNRQHYIMPFLWANNKELYLVKAGVQTGSTWTVSGVLYFVV